MTGNVTTPGPKVTGGAVGHVDLGNKVWPYVYTTTLREQKGYVSGMFGKCMNDGCGEQAQSDGKNLHNMARQRFAEHFHTLEWGHRPSQDPQLRRSDPSACVIRE